MLVEDGFLDASPVLREVDLNMPAEVQLTHRARIALDGWPGAAPEDLVENLLAVLAAAIAQETDPVRKTRLQRLAEDVREIGVNVAGEVLSKVVLGQS